MRNILLCAAAAGAILVSGCESGGSRSAVNRTLAGSAFGAAIGAVAGGALGGGAFDGAAAGAIAGGALGAAVKPPEREVRQYYRDTQGHCYYIDRRGRAIYDYSVRC